MNSRVWPLLALLPTLALAAEGPRTELELGGGYEQLDNGFQDWHGSYLAAYYQGEARQRAHLLLHQTTRYDLTDQELQGGVALPVADSWTVELEGSVSASHKVLPRWTTGIILSHTLGSGWGAHLGVKRREYASATVDSAHLGLEYYRGNWRGAYAITASQLAVGSAATTQRLQLDYFYGERNRIGVAYSAGQELEPLGASGVLYTKIHAAVVVGQHWFAPTWGLSYSLGEQRQGALYTRKGGVIGLRHLF